MIDQLISLIQQFEPDTTVQQHFIDYLHTCTEPELVVIESLLTEPDLTKYQQLQSQLHTIDQAKLDSILSKMEKLSEYRQTLPI